MDALISSVQAQYGKLRDQEPDTWVLIPPPRSEGGPLIPALCLEQIDDGDATVILLFRHESPGIYMTTYDDGGVLVLPGPVNADFDPTSMTDERVPDLRSDGTVLLGLSSRGLLFLFMQYATDKGYEGARSLDLDGLKRKTDLPTRVFWTREFTLRLPDEDGPLLYSGCAEN